MTAELYCHLFSVDPHILCDQKSLITFFIKYCSCRSEDFSYMVFCYKILEIASIEPDQEWPDYDPRPKSSLIHLLTYCLWRFSLLQSLRVAAENIYYLTLDRKKKRTGKIALDNGMDIMWIEVFTTGTFSRFYIIIV